MNALTENPDLWSDQEKAKKIMRERTSLADSIEAVRRMESQKEDCIELIEIAEMEGDDSFIKETEENLKKLKDEAARHELESLLSGDADSNDAYLQINAGAGGTESQDWASMLQRMYLRYAERAGYKTQILEQSDGEEAGIKSCTIEISGHNAYGWLKTETGVHRLVRISPFDSNAKRHTSFASVSVSPVIDDDIDIVIEDKDLRIDAYRSSGAGGQHVNTTDSAVRITHVPTGIVVACQNQRSQHQNKDTAMQMLKAKLYEKEMQEKLVAENQAYEDKTDIGWGHQIRSYVLHPYQMIKDLRTNVETSNTQSVLDGDIEMFLSSALAQGLEQRQTTA